MLLHHSLQRNVLIPSTRNFPWRVVCLPVKARFISQAAEREPLSLRRSFDDTNYWTNVNIPDGTQKITGLFNNPYLTSPQGLRAFSKESLTIARKIANLLKEDNTLEGYTNYILRLDQLSDTLCRIIDLCEFIRSSHPDKGFLQAAQTCHEEMFEFMNLLNTDIHLYDRLLNVLTNQEILSRLSEEEIKVGNLLLEDFKKSGIQMNSETREQFIQLSQEISVIGQDFLNNAPYVASDYIKIKCKDMDSLEMSSEFLQELQKDISGRYYKIPTYGPLAYAFLVNCPVEEFRKELWKEMYSCTEEQINRLKTLLGLRNSLATLMGKNNFAEYQQEGKMARKPEEVNKFLNSLVMSLKHNVAKELKPLAEMKLIEMNSRETLSENRIFELVRPWDRDYLSKFTRENLFDFSKLSEYFSLGTVMQGLSELFSNLYGIKFQPVVAEQGEVWSKDVRRINVISEDDGLIGIIYCDLFERDGKATNPAHFTICCSRETYPLEDDFSTVQTGISKTGKKFQLPVISLICNFRYNKRNDGNLLCLLKMPEVETLFHEMGHAIHSMLGRTKLQNLSGTRCVTDFVEIPSILMEYFAKDKTVLQKIGKHYKTQDSVPKSLIKKYQTESDYLDKCEMYTQAKMALLDQRLYGDSDIENFDIVDIYHNLEENLQIFIDNKSNWCGRFGHLFGYGAMYYSYLFDRAIASKIWDSLFENDPYSRENGMILKEQLLKWGGSKEPWQCISDVLQAPELAIGGSKAMEYVGSK